MAVNAVLTKKQRSKRCIALAEGTPIPKAQKMVLGSGGVEAQGTVKVPAETQETLNQQVIEKDILSFEYLNDEKTSCRYKVTLEENDAADAMLSEMALVDTDGDFIAIKNFLPKGKDADSRITFYIDIIE